MRSSFNADSCSAALGIPQCAEWLPDGLAFIKLLAHNVNHFLGAWCCVGIIAASMSTANGAILAMGTVMSHNVFRQLDAWFPTLITPDNLLNAARLTTIPFTVCSASIAAFYRSSSGNGTGYLLIVAFDIVFATVVVPLIGCFYCKRPSPRAALIGVLGGAVTRIVLEFVLPKDGFLLLPFDDIIFYNYGPAPNALFPFFIDVPLADVWDPNDGACKQTQFKDFTGVDSLVSPLVCLILFATIQVRQCCVFVVPTLAVARGSGRSHLTVLPLARVSHAQAIEFRTGKPLFHFAGSEAYLKDTTEHPLKKSLRIGNMGIPVAVFEEGDLDDPQETRISFADDSGKPIRTVIGEDAGAAAGAGDSAPEQPVEAGEATAAAEKETA